MSNSAANKIIPVLTGPTGSGKTGVAIRLLEKYPEIRVISADSRQIYKYLSIGTDKVSAELLEKYKFYLTDFVLPGERYTAFNFVRDAEKIIEDKIGADWPPLICGGTGLYIKSLVDGMVEIEDDDMTIRERLENEVISRGPKYLYEQLINIDPDEAKHIHPHNIKKIIRALEIFHLTGKTKSELIAENERKTGKYNFRIICLMPARDKLYDKINRRVDLMMESGLPDEVKWLCDTGYKETVEKINVIGYNETIKYIEGEIDLATAINLIKQNSRRYAKRQITWFRGMGKIEFVETAEEVYQLLLKIYRN